MRNTGSGSVPGLDFVRSQDPVEGHYQGLVRRVSPPSNRQSSNRQRSDADNLWNLIDCACLDTADFLILSTNRHLDSLLASI